MFGHDDFDGSQIDALNKYGQTRLHRAAEKGNMRLVKSLVAKGADISVIDKKGLTARLAAKQWKYRAIEEYLYELENEQILAGEARLLAEEARLAFEASEPMKKKRKEEERQREEEERRREGVERQREEDNKAQWFYSADLETQEGPISFIAMRKLLEKGSISNM